MDEPQLNAASEYLLVALSVASFALLWRLSRKLIKGKPLLEFEPRRPVPWTVVAPLILAVFSLGNLISSFWRGTPQGINDYDVAVQRALCAASAATPAPIRPISSAGIAMAVAADHAADSAASYITAIWAGAASLLFLTVTCYALLTAVFRATPADLGLPLSWARLRDDVLLGIGACIAALVPIYGLIILLSKLLQPEEPQAHEFIRMYEQSPSLAMFIAVAVTAVVVAPLFEETAFRLVLQGWLERKEMERKRDLIASQDAVDAEILAVTEEPGRESWPLPGWTPIIVSGLLFGAAHFSQSLAPAPLALLGFVLGYLYQRTHRLVPSIACHATFNAVTMLNAWLEFG